MECHLLQNNGRLWICVNGEVLPPMAYITYCPDEKRYALYRKNGMRLFSFHLPAGDQGINIQSGLRPFCPGFWTGPHQYDFAWVDRQLEMIAPPGSGVFVIPRVYLDAPLWWEKLHPQELSRSYSGEGLRQSFASQLWRTEAGEALEALLDHIGQSAWKENVIGYQVAAGGTEEWAYHRRFYEQMAGYCVPEITAYHNWLQLHYQSVQALNAAYGTHYTQWDQLAVPSPAQRRYAGNGVLRQLPDEQQVVDYQTFHNELVAATVLFFCERVKAATKGRLLAGAFYGYAGEIVNTDFGHHALHLLLDSDQIDFFASPNSYFHGRDPGCDWPYMGMVDSATLHGKLWFLETDTRTAQTGLLKATRPDVCPDAPIYEGGVWEGPNSHTLGLNLCRRNAARLVTGQTGAWWFDMWGGWFDHPDLQELIQKTNTLLKTPQNGELFPTQIAVVVDEQSFPYYTLDHPALYQLVYEQREAFAHIGAPAHWYLASDLKLAATRPNNYRLVVVLGAANVSDSLLQGVRILQKQGTTVLWVYLNDTTNQASATGFSVSYHRMDEERRGLWKGQCFPAKPISCGRFAQIQPCDRILACFDQSTDPCVIWRENVNGSQIYSLLPNMPRELLAEIADLAGVHRYIRSGDLVYAGGSFIGVQAVSEGWKRICFSQDAPNVREVFSDQQCRSNGPYVDFYMTLHETMLFYCDRS